MFRSELNERGIDYSTTAEDLYAIRLDDQTVTVSLENIRRDYERDGDPDAIVRFVDRIEGVIHEETPPWEELRPYIRYSLEPTDYETGFDEVLVNKVSDELIQVFVYTSTNWSQITWINESSLATWGVTREEVIRQAEENMSEILAQTTLEVQAPSRPRTWYLFPPRKHPSRHR